MTLPERRDASVLCGTEHEHPEACVSARALVDVASLRCVFSSAQTVGGASQDKPPELDTGASHAGEQERSHSNSSSLSDRRLSSSSLCSVEEQHRPLYDMVQRILLSTRGYVNFVNEVFRQVGACVQWLLGAFPKASVMVMRQNAAEAGGQVTGQTGCDTPAPFSLESFLGLALTAVL